MSIVYPFDDADPLSSAHAKIERANVHIEELIHSISDTTDPDITVTRKGNLTGGSGHPISGSAVDDVQIKARDPIPWSVMIGDAVTNLRSALDHIAWALADKYVAEARITLKPSDERGISFPLGHDPANFGASRFILPEARPVIESFQPYNRTKRPELELLGILDELSRTDKHRLVIPIERLVRLRLNAAQSKIIRAPLNYPYHQWLLSAPTIENDFEPEGVFDIVMYPALRGDRGFSSLELRDIYNLIRDEVLPAFTGFFT